jgi:hypothetical protein
LLAGFIDSHRGRFGVEPVCGPGIPVSTHYAVKKREREPPARAARDGQLKEQIMRVWENRRKGRRLYGAQKVWLQALHPPMTIRHRRWVFVGPQSMRRLSHVQHSIVRPLPTMRLLLMATLAWPIQTEIPLWSLPAASVAGEQLPSGLIAARERDTKDGE